MTDMTARTPDVDKSLVDRLFNLHTPADQAIGELLDDLRQRYINLADAIVERVPRTPDRTIALRSLHRACMDTIFAAVADQDQP